MNGMYYCYYKRVGVCVCTTVRVCIYMCVEGTFAHNVRTCGPLPVSACFRACVCVCVSACARVCACV